MYLHVCIIKFAQLLATTSYDILVTFENRHILSFNLLFLVRVSLFWKYADIS